MEATKIVYGVKYYVKDVGTEFDIFQSLSEAEKFWNNKSFEKIIPMKIVKGLVNSDALLKNKDGETVFNDDYCFQALETIKSNA